MHDVLLSQIFKPLIDVTKVFPTMRLVDEGCLAKPRLKVPLVADLCDDVTIVSAGENFETVEDVGVLQGFEDLNLGVQKLDESGGTHAAELNYLDCYHIA